MLDNFLAKHYHQPSDEVTPSFDYSGAVEDARLFFEVGYRVAQDSGRPRWKPTTQYASFKAAHDSMLARAAGQDRPR